MLYIKIKYLNIQDIDSSSQSLLRLLVIYLNVKKGGIFLFSL